MRLDYTFLIGYAMRAKINALRGIGEKKKKKEKEGRKTTGVVSQSRRRTESRAVSLARPVEKCITRRARSVGSAACGHNISCGETEKVAGQVGNRPACGGMDRCR